MASKWINALSKAAGRKSIDRLNGLVVNGVALINVGISI